MITNPQFDTLLEMLAYRDRTSGAQAAFTFAGITVTFETLWSGVNRFAASLHRSGLERGEPVILLLPNGPAFFFAFYGVQRAGGIAVPIFPDSGIERTFNFAQRCGARRIVLPEAQIGYTTAAQANHMQLSRVDEALKADPHGLVLPEILPDDLAFLQYTSGSTGEPKGVMLSQSNLLTNATQMIAGMEISQDEIFVSWLPVYHDMGLILKTIVPFYLAARLYLLPTDLRNVHTWLKTIQDTRATFTAAPDFAYRLCIRASCANARAYDLSSLRVALNAAEPVRVGTIRDFEQVFGLDRVMVAGYGLAEATVGVSMMKPGSPPRVDKHGLVSVGQPFPGVEIRIIQNGKEITQGEVGEIAIRSIANSRGYYHDPEASIDLKWGDGYILSGDLGYLGADGYLTIVGRKKNTIKHAGETLAPQEIEEFVDAAPDVRYSAAVGIDRGQFEGEQVYIFTEMRKQPSPEAAEEIIIRIVNEFHDRLGFRPGRVYLLKAHSIPRTHNGKIQHALLKERYLSSELRTQGQIIYPEY